MNTPFPLNGPVRSLGRWFLWLVLTAPAWAQSPVQLNYTTPYAFATLAGTTSTGSENGLNARLCLPQDVAVDAAGNLYIADTGNRTIRKRTPDGRVSTLAGLAAEIGSTDGTGATARFASPIGIAVDSTGNVYVADADAHVIRKISPAGVATTLAGAPGSLGSLDGNGTAARFNRPTSVGVDTAGNVYVADSGNYTIRKITPAGVVTTFAGSVGQRGTTDGVGGSARFDSMAGVAVDQAGNVYVAEYFNARIRKITPAGETSTLAGQTNSFGHVDGTGSAARFAYPTGVAVDAAGNVYVSSHNSTVRKVTPSGTVTTLAGANDVWDSNDGPGPVARFKNPEGLAVDPAGNVYVADTDNNTIRRVAPDTTVSTIAGVSVKGSQGHADGNGSAARFSARADLVVDSSGNLYVADPGNHCIRKVTPAGMVTTFVGSPANIGSVDGTGAAASFGRPTGIAIDAGGTLYVADADFHVIRKVTPSGVVSTIAGQVGQPGLVDGTGTAARFNGPTGMDLDAAGNLYVMDRENSALRMITPAGGVTTLVNHASFVGFPITVFLKPGQITVARTGRFAGSLFVADYNSHTIRQVITGSLFPVAGSGYLPGYNDGSGASAGFNLPADIAMDQTENLYVTDLGNSLVRRINAVDGVVTTLGGSHFTDSRLDGVGEHAGFEAPYGLTADGAGNIYVTDSGSIRKGRLATAPVITSQPQNQTVSSGGSVSFTVATSGAPDPTYQWNLNGAPFAGATSSTLSFSNARSSDAGNYTVTVTNALGTVTSNVATLTVNASSNPPPSGGGGGGGGGGAPSAGFLLALFTAAMVRRHLPPRNRKA